MHLNQKQNSRDGISRYNSNKNKVDNSSICSQVSQITNDILKADSLEAFDQLVIKHENLISNTVGLAKVKDLLFSDYKAGVCKSLGAWGGDFILVTGTSDDMVYFKNKGYNTITPFSDMIL